MTDEEIVELVAGGDIDKYGEIVVRYQEKLKRYVKRVINQADEEVEDIVQETFIKGYENVLGFDGTKKFGSWIFRIAHNLCIDYFRKKRMKTESIDEKDEWFDAGTKLIEELAMESEDKKKISAAVEKLEINYREVVLLYYFEEKSYEEIADILRTNTSNVGVLLSRAKTKLRKLIYEI